eukprot:1847136-Amphidinium_carterae.1
MPFCFNCAGDATAELIAAAVLFLADYVPPSRTHSQAKLVLEGFQGLPLHMLGLIVGRGRRALLTA